MTTDELIHRQAFPDERKLVPPNKIRDQRSEVCSSKVAGAQSASLDDALKRADWDRLVAMHGDNYLPTVGVTPFLMAAFLTDLAKSVFAQDSNDFFPAANRETLAHVSATSSTLAPGGNVTGAGSNHSSRASFALPTASSSVSPAEAHPGSSGKNAAQRLVLGSCSTTSRSFMRERITSGGSAGKPEIVNRLATASPSTGGHGE
jgi:hypothetical protein